MKKIITFSLSVFSFLGLLKIFSIVPFNRMAADDFNYAYAAITNGLLGSQIVWYTEWTGRFVSTFLQSLFGLMSGNSGNAILFSVITFTSLLISFIFFFKRMLNLKALNWMTLLLSVSSFVSLYILTPNKKESWYWMAGTVTYLWPIVFLLIGVSYLFVKKPKKIDYVLSFLFMFLAGGGNETLSLSTCLSLGVFMLYSYFSKKWNRVLLLVFIGVVLSFACVYLAQGNSLRSVGGGSNPMSLFGSVLYALQTGPLYLYSIVWNNLIYILPLVFCFAFLFASLNTEQNLSLEDLLKRIFYLIIAPVVVSVVYMLPSFKILGRVPPDRSDITLSLIILAVIVSVSFCLGQLFSLVKNKSSAPFMMSAALASVALFASSFVITQSLAGDIYIAKDYSSAFDKVILEVKSAANEKKAGIIIVDKLPESGLIGSADLKGYPDNEKNNAIARYYGIDVIMVK